MLRQFWCPTIKTTLRFKMELGIRRKLVDTCKEVSGCNPTFPVTFHDVTSKMLSSSLSS